MGRDHRAEDIVTAYDIVRASGVPMVNMDLIAGLPRDTVDGFRYTLDRVLEMAPENITVHLSLIHISPSPTRTWSGSSPPPSPTWWRESPS